MPSKAKPSQHRLGDLLKKAKARVESPTRQLPPDLVVKSISLTPAALAILERYVRQISSATNRKTSASAVIRAMLRQMDRERPDLVPVLATLVDTEAHTGEVVWGKSGRL